MVQTDDLVDLSEEWRVFLQQDHDAQVIVQGFIERTGLTEDEALYVLMEIWAERKLRLQQQRDIGDWVYPMTRMN